jgi:hypothetical protein
MLCCVNSSARRELAQGDTDVAYQKQVHLNVIIYQRVPLVSVLLLAAYLSGQVGALECWSFAFDCCRTFVFFFFFLLLPIIILFNMFIYRGLHG